MNTIKLCTSIMIAAALCASCSSESTTPETPEGHSVNGVFAKFVSFRSGPTESTAVDITITNNTDYTATFFRCDSYGYLGDALVATMEDQDMFNTPLTDYDLQPGQTKAALLIFSDNLENTQLSRVEWVCSYRGGDDAFVMFEGNS